MPKPIYTAIAAVSVDGKIARHARHFSDWTSKEDKVLMRQQLDQSDVIVVGNRTYKLAAKPLSHRNCIVLTRSVKMVEKDGANLTYCNADNFSLAELVTGQGYVNVAILGGTEVYSFCLQENLIDQLYLTIEPVIFGSGLPLFNCDYQYRLNLESIERINSIGSIRLRYKK